MQAVTKTDIKELNKLFSGKVRDIYEVDDQRLLIVATDRISAFDVVFNEGIPEKGRILTRISNKWFSMVDHPHHLISTEPEKELPFLENYPELKGRSVLVKRFKRIDIEFVARGYLFGSAYKDYVKTGQVCGTKLPQGLQLAERLPEPIFTPATKAASGHDENITIEEYKKVIGNEELADYLMETTLKIYKWAHDLLIEKGIILADTKLEFGLDEEGRPYIIDEMITPDSSRFWLVETYKPGISPPNFDKQFIRDYLESLDWNKQPPPPPLPQEIIEKTLERYKAIEKIILSL
ncbi:phosphoribosylaminoimidazole-succinocarboxamide synthase [Thermosulfidibacter takaii ABI70S6]|uniref:Phosphoribosylaminoimidazole-succinocarboxamide synthase n=1 Tax=Thermosulfidibacter takaii (strain DSM 17441 / JCM 13301 / NBRC 103674 / ABI70S6) TaxID=1298851 RepID=A0A0S3QTI2_THET7|nr:phosphoribosylaminoimidazolesuccinocarboxamide synthase [Thermosulfidibacter takaii]BAT71621.1 phosphoribosylaminoimidazole-succinocarboxamide synthase [Thermosulfidibacter takaii ABI70S6]